MSLLALFASTAHATPELEAQLDRLQRDPFLARAVVATAVRDTRTSEVLYAENADTLLTPASTVKLVTAAAALSIRGPDAVFETTFAAGGPVDGGVLNGDLVVIGAGDPSLGIPADGRDALAPFRVWARALIQAGVRRIEGDVVADDRVFAWQPLGTGWSWDDALWRYGAPITGLNVHHNTATVRVAPTAPGEPAEVEVPDLPWCVPIDAQVVTGDAALKASRDVWSPVTRLRGQVAAPRTLTVTLPDPPACFAETLARVLASEGVEVAGRARRVDRDAPPPDPSTPLVVHTSEPMSALLAHTLQQSDNLYAEAVARSLDPVAQGRDFPRDVFTGVLRRAGVPDDAHDLYDGSGLSRMDLLTAEALVRLLRWADRQPWREPWRAAMATPGDPGTLRARMVGGPAEDRVRGKTGSMTGVFNVAGYVTTDDERELAFAFLTDGVVQPGASVRTAQDMALEVLASVDAPPRRRPFRKRRR